MMPVVILSGGLATRMRPLTEKIPKSMLDVNGVPFIEHQLRLLQKNKIRRVLLCTGFLSEIIEDYVGTGARYDMSVEYYNDGEVRLGTGGAIKNIGGNIPEEFFVLYGDSYLEADYAKIEADYRKSGKKGLMTVYKNDGKYDACNVIFRDNKIICYSKTKKSPEMNYIDWGLGILTKEIFDDIPPGTRFDLAAVYEKLTEENELHGYEVKRRFYEIGSFEGLESLRAKLAESAA